MQAKYKENDKVWIIINGARPKQMIVKSVELVHYQNHSNFVYTFNRSIKRTEDKVSSNKKGVLT